MSCKHCKVQFDPSKNTTCTSNVVSRSHRGTQYMREFVNGNDVGTGIYFAHCGTCNQDIRAADCHPLYSQHEL